MAKPLGGTFAKSLSRHYHRGEKLVPHLNNWFSRGVFPDEINFSINPNKEHDDAFHPSSSTKCARLVYALREGHVEGEKPTGDQHKMFMIGHYYHALIQHIVVEGLGFATWDQIEKEFYFSDDAPGATHPGFCTQYGNEYDVRGFLDIARCIIPNEGEFLVDIKTVAARLYAMNELPAETWRKYVSQVQMYLEFEGLDTAILLCAEKDNPHRFKEFLIHADGSAVDETMARWESVVDAQVAGSPPDCTCQDEGKCPVREIYDVATY